jgi:hypothetical protein
MKVSKTCDGCTGHVSQRFARHVLDFLYPGLPVPAREEP